MQSGPSSPLDDNFITAVHQYCMGGSSSYKLFWSEAAQQARALLCKIYFSWDTIIISNSYQSVWEQQDLLRYHNRDISFMCIGMAINITTWVGRQALPLILGLPTSHCPGDWQRWGLITCILMELNKAWNLRASSHGRELAFTNI